MSDNERVNIEGLTQPQVISRRVLEVVEQIIYDLSQCNITLEQAAYAVNIIISVNLPFMTPSAKATVTDIQTSFLNEVRNRLSEVERGMKAAVASPDMKDCGTWA